MRKFQHIQKQNVARLIDGGPARRLTYHTRYPSLDTAYTKDDTPSRPTHSMSMYK
jgi:hypothetical protein